MSQEVNVRNQIKQFMSDLEDEEYFTKSEIEQFVTIAVSKKLSVSQIYDALEQHSKDYGEFA
jgi:hypothetical protein